MGFSSAAFCEGESDRRIANIFFSDSWVVIAQARRFRLFTIRSFLVFFPKDTLCVSRNEVVSFNNAANNLVKVCWPVAVISEACFRMHTSSALLRLRQMAGVGLSVALANRYCLQGDPKQ
jgi:hypothetical protein